MAIDVERVIEKGLETAFRRALDRVIREKVGAIFVQMFASSSPFGKRLEAKIEAGLQRLLRQSVSGEPS